MTLDQLTQLASRVTDTSIPIYAFTLDELVALAEAVAAAERERCALVCEAEAENGRAGTNCPHPEPVKYSLTADDEQEIGTRGDA